MALVLSLLLGLQDPVTKDDLLKLARGGADEKTLLERIGDVKLALSADDIVELKKAGVTDAVLARLAGGPSEAKVSNLAQHAVRVLVRGKTVDVNFSDGQELKPGASADLPLSGEYAVTLAGRKTTARILTPATLTFRGADVTDFDVMTLVIEDARGRETLFVHLKDKTPERRVDALPRRGGAGGYLDRTFMERMVDGMTGVIGGVADGLFGL